MMNVLTFTELSSFILAWAQLPADERIQPATQFERDLGITGDDGDALLKAVEKRFSIQLSIEMFDLKPNEYLFHGEAIPFWEIFPWAKKTIVRAFTVGELYAVIEKAMKQ